MDEQQSAVTPEGNPEPKKKSGKMVALIIILILALLGIAVCILYFAKEEKEMAPTAEPTPTETPAATKTPSPSPIPTETPSPSPTPTPAEIPVCFDDCKAVNSDIYAWVSVPLCNIEYPVLRSPGKDKDYYLNHTVDGATGLPGAIFTEWDKNGDDFSDRVTVIYGHNMKNGTMFAKLHLLEDESILTQHPYFYIYTPTTIRKYEIIFVENYSNVLILKHYDCTTDEGYSDFMKSVETADYGMKWLSDQFYVSREDRLVVLSTCNGNEEERFLVGGRLISEEPGIPISHADTETVTSENAANTTEE